MFDLLNRNAGNDAERVPDSLGNGNINAQSVLEVMPANIMLCSLPNFEITCMNESCKTTLRAIEHELPIKVDDMIGSSIDVFHKKPEYQRGIQNNPANLPHTARIKLGNEHLRLEITALYDAQGTYTGPILTWQWPKKGWLQNRLGDLLECVFCAEHHVIGVWLICRNFFERIAELPPRAGFSGV